MLGQLKVIVMKKNGFINATHLCKTCDKDFHDWYNETYSKELIEEVKTETPKLGLKAIKNPVIENNDGPEFVRGYYVHSDIIINIAMWCSSRYARLVSNILEEESPINLI